MGKPIIAITTGEPTGIGPEIAIRGALDCLDSLQPILIGDYHQLASLAQQMGYGPLMHRLPAEGLSKAGFVPLSGKLVVVDKPLAVPPVAGRLDARNAPAVLAFMDIAIDGALDGIFDAVVTAPVQKSIINDAGIPFTGHTEYFAERTRTERVVMMLAGKIQQNNGLPSGTDLRVALATTHLPLKDVSDAITAVGLMETVSIIHKDMKNRFGLASPRILMTGLNPHAGENGYLGMEETEILKPAIQHLRQQGIDITGPYPADTLFQPHFLENADCILAMYHDQGLPVLKYATFGHGVNITLGMPIIRTSVDHGTALDIAVKGLGIANAGSMSVALRTAADMAANTSRTL
ncbi:MAG: 4-hydroxythreonine-4-phosphate dehydrogenase PdxA [Oxalobacter sp.]|nr:4-hydroxythreonine-4-phosphate dehydrogenase PdxA [Oxalobacter sp.]